MAYRYSSQQALDNAQADALSAQSANEATKTQHAYERQRAGQAASKAKTLRDNYNSSSVKQRIEGGGDGPQTIDNPYFVPTESAPGSGARPFYMEPQEGSGSIENTARARGMLAEGSFESEAHKKRLEKIVRVGDRTEQTKQRVWASKDDESRRMQQEQINFQQKKLIEENIKNPYTKDELDQINGQIAAVSTAAVQAPIIQVARANEDASDPAKLIANAVDSFVEAYGADPSRVQTLMTPESKDKGIPWQQAHAVDKLLREEKFGSSSEISARQTAVKNELSTISATKNGIRDGGVLFDSETKQMNLMPEYTPENLVEVGRYIDERELWDAANARQAELMKMQHEFSTPRVAPSAAYNSNTNPAALPEEMATEQLTQGTTTPQELMQQAAVKGGQGNASSPLQLVPGEDPAVYVSRIQKAVSDTKATVYFVNPDTNKVMELSP